MDIKVAAFTVSEKSSNMPVHCPYKVYYQEMIVANCLLLLRIISKSSSKKVVFRLSETENEPGHVVSNNLTF